MSIVNPNQGTSVTEATKKLSGILSERPQETPTDAKEPEEAVNNPEVEAETPNQGDTEPKPRRLKTKLGDREIEYEILADIDDDEAENLRLSTMMESDYRKKTSELSKERQKIEAEAEKLNSKLSDLEDILTFDQSWLESDEAKELREDYPDEYLNKIESIKRKAEKYQKYKAEQQEKIQAKYQEQTKAEIAKYSQAIPEWLDESKRNEDLGKIEQTLRKTGFDDEMIGKVWGTDHKLMSLLRKAALFDAIQSKSIDDKRVKVTPKSVKPSSTNSISVEKTAKQKALDKLKQTGATRDAQAALKAILGG